MIYPYTKIFLTTDISLNKNLSNYWYIPSQTSFWFLIYPWQKHSKSWYIPDQIFLTPDISLHTHLSNSWYTPSQTSFWPLIYSYTKTVHMTISEWTITDLLLLYLANQSHFWLGNLILHNLVILQYSICFQYAHNKLT